MKCFSKILVTNSPKNNLHRAVLDMIDQYDRLLVDSEHAFVLDLQNTLSLLSAEHPKCRPVIASLLPRRTGDDLHLYVRVNHSYNDTICSLMLYKVCGSFQAETQEGGEG